MVLVRLRLFFCSIHSHFIQHFVAVLCLFVSVSPCKHHSSFIFRFFVALVLSLIVMKYGNSSFVLRSKFVAKQQRKKKKD